MTTKQIGGTHYSNLPIQPMEYALKNGLNFAQGNVVKYVTRYKSKGGIEDLHKAAHYIEVLIQHETERAPPEWPSEERIDAIGQNGATAEHYKPELLAIPDDVVIPDRVEWIGVDTDGTAHGFTECPRVYSIGYACQVGSPWVKLWRADAGARKLYKHTPDGFELVLD